MGPKGSTVVHSMCSVTKELNAGGTDGVCEPWLVSELADLLTNVGPPQSV